MGIDNHNVGVIEEFVENFLLDVLVEGLDEGIEFVFLLPVGVLAIHDLEVLVDGLEVLLVVLGLHEELAVDDVADLLLEVAYELLPQFFAGVEHTVLVELPYFVRVVALGEQRSARHHCHDLLLAALQGQAADVRPYGAGQHERRRAGRAARVLQQARVAQRTRVLLGAGQSSAVGGQLVALGALLVGGRRWRGNHRGRRLPFLLCLGRLSLGWLHRYTTESNNGQWVNLRINHGLNCPLRRG